MTAPYTYPTLTPIFPNLIAESQHINQHRSANSESVLHLQTSTSLIALIQYGVMNFIKNYIVSLILDFPWLDTRME